MLRQCVNSAIFDFFVRVSDIQGKTKLSFNVSETNWLPAPGDTFVKFTFEIQFALNLTLAIASLWNLHLLEEGKSIGKVKDKEDIIME